MSHEQSLLADLYLEVPELKQATVSMDDACLGLERNFRVRSGNIAWLNPETAFVGAADTDPDFVTKAVSEYSTDKDLELLFVADHGIDSPYLFPAHALKKLTEVAVSHPYGFWIGPSDSRWEWVVEVRMTGSCYVGRPER